MPSTPTLRPFTHVSVSQIQSWIRCRRLWWFSKILALPREEKTHFTFGSVLHKCAERALAGDDPFPDGWDQELRVEEEWEKIAADIRGLIEGAVERGILKPLPNQFIELKLEVPLGAGRPFFVGYIDHGSLGKETPAVIDHKTVSDVKWAKTALDLLEDFQLLTYAFCLLQLYREKYQANPAGIVLRHNVFVKGLEGQETALAKALGVEPQMRWKIVEAQPQLSELEDHWVRALQTIDRMIPDASVTDWREFPDPPRTACTMYARRGEVYGCDYAKICHEGMSVEDYTASLNQKEDAVMPEEKKMTAASALAKFGKGKKAIPKPKPTTVTQEDPQEEAPQPSSTTAPPWHRPDCPACKGSPNGAGFKKKDPVPCGICVMWAGENGHPLPDQFDIFVPESGGRPSWSLKVDQDVEDPQLQVNGPTPDGGVSKTPKAKPGQFATQLDEAIAKLNRQGSPVAEEKPAAEPLAKPEEQPEEKPEEKPKKKRGPGRPKGSKNKPKPTPEPEPEAEPEPEPEAEPLQRVVHAPRDRSYAGFVLAIDCMPMVQPDELFVTRLSECFLGSDPWWAKLVAEGLEQPNMPWPGLDPFKRVDAAIGLIPTILDRLEGTLVLANTGPHELRGLIEALRSYATQTWIRT